MSFCSVKEDQKADADRDENAKYGAVVIKPQLDHQRIGDASYN